MTRTALTVQEVVRTGITPSFGAAQTTDGNSFPNDGNTYIEVKNTTATACTVTIQEPETVDGLAVADRTVSVPGTTGDKVIGPFPPARYNQSDGSVYVDVSKAVTLGAFRLKGA